MVSKRGRLFGKIWKLNQPLRAQVWFIDYIARTNSLSMVPVYTLLACFGFKR